MEVEPLFSLVAEHGPWAMLVFYLLFRDAQKDLVTREVLNKNTAVLIELATLMRARAMQGIVDR